MAHLMPQVPISPLQHLQSLFTQYRFGSSPWLSTLQCPTRYLPPYLAPVARLWGQAFVRQQQPNDDHRSDYEDGKGEGVSLAGQEEDTSDGSVGSCQDPH